MRGETRVSSVAVRIILSTSAVLAGFLLFVASLQFNLALALTVASVFVVAAALPWTTVASRTSDSARSSKWGDGLVIGAMSFVVISASFLALEIWPILAVFVASAGALGLLFVVAAVFAVPRWVFAVWFAGAGTSATVATALTLSVIFQSAVLLWAFFVLLEAWLLFWVWKGYVN